MSIKSTYTISRNKIIELIISKLLSASNDELGDAYEFLDREANHFRNFDVVDELPAESDKWEREDFIIR